MTPNTTLRRPASMAIALTAQIAAGLALGAALAFLGATLGGRFFAGDGQGFRDIIAMLGGLLLGYPLGATGGVWLAGRLLGRPAPLWAPAAGAALGVGLMLLVAPLLNDAAPLAWGLIFALSLAGALAGHHLAAGRARR